MGKKVKRIGVLTSGGDAPGMNAAVRAVVRSAVAYGIECVGIRRGWQGLINSDFVMLPRESVGHILNRGGIFAPQAFVLFFSQENAMLIREHIYSEIAHIVPCIDILFSRITEPGYYPHRKYSGGSDL